MRTILDLILRVNRFITDLVITLYPLRAVCQVGKRTSAENEAGSRTGGLSGKIAAMASTSPPTTIDESTLASSLTGEVYWALGLSKTGFLRATTGWVFRPIARRFARMWLDFDHNFLREGLQLAARDFLTPLVKEVKACGAEHIPSSGPLIIASNHPGAYDSISIMSQIPHPNLKVITGDIPIFNLLPHAPEVVIFAYGAAGNPSSSVRAGIRHLKAGGALLIFPTGFIDPDPDLWDDAAEHLEHWSPSLEVFLRHAPETRIVVTITSGVLSPRWARSRIARLRRNGHEHRRLAEFLQVMAQLVRPGRDLYTTRLSFAPALSLADLGGGDGPVLENLIARAKALLQEHMTWR